VLFAQFPYVITDREGLDLLLESPQWKMVETTSRKLSLKEEKERKVRLSWKDRE
jgi:hypothetical protein